MHTKKKLFTADPKLAGALKCTDAQIRNSNRDRERDKRTNIIKVTQESNKRKLYDGKIKACFINV